MPSFGPIKRTDLIRYLQKAGFEGPLPGGKHQIMRRGQVTIAVPNPHRGDIASDLLARILRRAGLSHEEWEVL